MTFAALAAAALAENYAVLGELVTVDGDDITAIFDGGYAESLDAAGTAPSLRCIAADVAAVAVGDTVVRDGITYKVRNLLPIAPDELETRLVLERQS